MTLSRWRAFALGMTRAGAIVALLLLPVWYRLPADALPGTDLYVTRFALALAVAWTGAWWLASGCAGVRTRLLASRVRLAWAAALLVLAGWAALSQSWAFMRLSRPDVAENAALQFGLATLFALALACCGLRPRSAALALGVGLAWNAALVIVQALAGGAIGLLALGEFPVRADTPGVSIVRAGAQVFVRPYGLLPHPNIAAGILLPGVLAAIGAWAARSRAWRRAGVLLAPVGLLALLLTFSRAAWLGLALGGLVLALAGLKPLRRPDVRRAALAGVLLCLAVAVAFALLCWPLLSARTQGSEPTEMRSIADRIVYTDFALRAISEHPLTGVGVGNFGWQSSAYLRETFYALRGDNVHNIYLLVWAELGTPGVLLFVLALLCGVTGGARAVRATGDPFRAALLASACGLMLIGLLDHYPHSLLHGQVALWGALALAGAPLTRSEAAGMVY